MASGQGSHWFIESPTIFHLCVTRPSEMFVNFVFKHIHTASICTICRKSVDNLFHKINVCNKRISDKIINYKIVSNV